MKIGVLLSGCGVYDGVEIQEAVLAMLAIEELGGTAVPLSVNKNQYHVVNHLTGEEQAGESRNMMVEAARISRGNVVEITKINPADLDGLVIPGGFGSAKNFSDWAFNGAAGTILPEVKLLLVNLVNIGKPIVALCVSPILISKAFEGSTVHTELTIGTSNEPSPYDISSFVSGLEFCGSETTPKSVREIHIDKKNKIITAPCYMMDASMLEVRKNIQQAVTAMRDLL